MDALYRAIIGPVEPLLRNHEVPEQYRQTLPAPLAPESEAEGLEQNATLQKAS